MLNIREADISSSKTYTEIIGNSASASASDKTRRRPTVLGEDLPLLNATIDADKADNYTITIDLLLDIANKREVFTSYYKNANYLL